MSCGVPQGSVVGPLLWNITYDAVLTVGLPADTSVIGFADDTMVLARGTNSKIAEVNVNAALKTASSRITSLGLSLAVEKTEAILFCSQYKMPNPVVLLNGRAVEVKNTIKYLGILVDKDLMYREHIRAAASKGHCAMTALSRLMPNIGGPKEQRRHLLVSVVHSVLLYGAPIWADSLTYSKPCTEVMIRTQRRAALRKACAYQTVYNDAINVITTLPPIDLLAKERKISYENLRTTPTGNSSPRRATLEEWKRRYTEGTKGQRTRELILDWDSWVSRNHGLMDYHLTQIFTSHGCFGSYLFKIGKATTAACLHCGAPEDSASHTFFECTAWNAERNTLQDRIGNLQRNMVVQRMLESKEKWSAVATFASSVLFAKEEAERLGQRQTNS